MRGVSAVTRQPLSLRAGARDNLGSGRGRPGMGAGRGMGSAWHGMACRNELEIKNTMKSTYTDIVSFGMPYNYVAVRR